MSKITEAKGVEWKTAHAKEQEEVIAKIRKIVGSKKFTFSDAYVGKCGKSITVGKDGRTYSGVTKRYVYTNCFLQYGYNDEKTEYGAIIKRYPICYKTGSGSFVEKVELEDLFIEDLKKILEDIKFSLWWEATIHAPEVKKKYEEVMAYVDKYEKLKNE